MSVEDKIKQAIRGFIENKAQLTESGDVYVTVNINIGNKSYSTGIPPNADIKKVKESEITPDTERIIEERIRKRLSDHEDRVSSLPESKIDQFIADSTAATFVEILTENENDTT